MVSIFATWLLCSICFIGGFILCSLVVVGQKADNIASVPTHDDYIDWSKVPEGYDWASCSNENVQLWKNKPDEIIDMWSSYNEVFMFPEELECSNAIIGPLPPWRESLRKRPGSKA
jgi:hypothetical protein